MLDDDGDGGLRKNEFVKSFYRLIDNDAFQTNCMFQLGLNEIKYDIGQFAKEAMRRFTTLENIVDSIAKERGSENTRHSGAFGSTEQAPEQAPELFQQNE